jgi:hypothetical protein
MAGAYVIISVDEVKEGGARKEETNKQGMIAGSSRAELSSYR